MTPKRAFIAIVIGTLAPTLAALQVLQLADLTNVEYWLGVATLGITSFAASGTTILTTLAGEQNIHLPNKVNLTVSEEETRVD